MFFNLRGSEQGGGGYGTLEGVKTSQYKPIRESAGVDDMLRSPDPVAWVVVLVVITAVDFVWFTFLSGNVYQLNTLVDPDKVIVKAPFAVFTCAALASLVLCSFRSNDYGEAALTGAAVGGLVFYVFNICAWYLLENLKSQGSASWPWSRAVVDFLYGTLLYTLVSMLRYTLSGRP